MLKTLTQSLEISGFVNIFTASKLLALCCVSYIFKKTHHHQNKPKNFYTNALLNSPNSNKYMHNTDTISQWKSEITQQEFKIMQLRCNMQSSAITNNIYNISNTETISKEDTYSINYKLVTDISPTSSSIHHDQISTVTADNIIKQISLEFGLNCHPSPHIPQR